MDYSRKKISNIGRGVEDIKFPGVSRKQHVQFPMVTKKKYGVSKGLCFWPWSSIVLSGISRGKVKNEKFQEGFHKIYPQPPLFRFFLE